MKNHRWRLIIVIECIILSSDLTDLWVNDRDVCNKSSRSINTVNFKYESNGGPVCLCQHGKNW